MNEHIAKRDEINSFNALKSFHPLVIPADIRKVYDEIRVSMP